MDCADFALLVGHAVDGELTEELRAAAERHALRCARCREEVESLRTQGEWLAAAFGPEPIPADAREPALRRIAAELALPDGRPPIPGQLVLFTDAAERRTRFADSPDRAAADM